MNVTTVDLTPRIGTEIKAGLETLLDGSAGAECRRILEERGVIVFRELNLDDRQQVAFARTLGELDRVGKDGIFKIALNKEQNRGAGEYLAAEYMKGTFFWHIDGTTADLPNRATLLSAHQLSAAGGQTEFANTYAAYDDLPESEQKYLGYITGQTISASGRPLSALVYSRTVRFFFGHSEQQLTSKRE
jgi:alpha-ketoglutarate-dependent taurine dioxygenase